MDVSIATSLIATSGAIIVAGASYWFTKKREREAVLRREKLAHLVAPQTVLNAASGTTGILVSEPVANAAVFRGIPGLPRSLNAVERSAVVREPSHPQQVQAATGARVLSAHGYQPAMVSARGRPTNRWCAVREGRIEPSKSLNGVERNPSRRRISIPRRLLRRIPRLA